MVNRFTIVRPGEPLPNGLQSAEKKVIDLSDPVIKTDAKAETIKAPEATVTPQPNDRFQTEIYKAMEILGRKLERAEDENARLAGRLAQIESATAIDETTGRVYLPALLNTAQAQQNGTTGATAALSLLATRSTLAASAFSVMIAFFALGLAYFHQPQASVTAGIVLTNEQLAALDAITAQHMAGLNTAHQATPVTEAAAAEQLKSGSWRSIDNFDDKDQAAAVPADAIDVFTKQPVKDNSIATGLAPETDPALNADTLATLMPQDKNKPVVLSVPVQAVDVDTVAAVPAENVTQPENKQAITASNANDVADASPAYSGIEKDVNLPASLQKVEKRAFDGVAEAQHDLATVYASGKSVPQDYKRAVYWFSRAADGGIANAHYNLGVMFQQGLGLHKDAAKAIGWYKSAAELGHPEAMYNLGIAYIDGVGVAQNVDRGASYFKRAAAAGVAQAAYNLGVLYESGFLGAVDLDQALHWYTEAKAKKHADAAAAIARIRKQKQAAVKLPPSLPADAQAVDLLSE